MVLSMTDPTGFDKDTSTMTKSILDLTLEIIFLPTGEDYIVVKKASGEHLATNSCPPVSWEGPPTVEPPLPSRISERKDQKIMDLTNKIIELLTGEVPIRCQDVTVHFSMEEWEYLEGHKGLYKDFFEEDYQPFTSVDGCKKKMEGNLLSSSDFEGKTTSITQDSSGKNYISPDICPRLHSRLPPSDPPEEKQSSSDHSQTVTQSTNYIEGEILPSPESQCGESSQSSYNGKCSLSENIECFTQNDKNVNSFLPTECGKCFDQKSALVEHGGVDSEEKPYSCLACGKRFTQKTGLVEHQKTHTGERPLSCSECGKLFSRKSHLIRHHRTHTGERPFPCSECGKLFSRKSHLIRHHRAHTGEKPFPCSECGKCFAHKSVLLEHQKRHTGEDLFSCSECGKSFTKNSALIIHQRFHTGEKPFTCSECEKGFTQKCALVKHLRIHSGEKPYSCAVCSKGFIQKSDLVEHERIHTGEKPFKCLACGRSFTHRGNLVKHQVRHSH